MFFAERGEHLGRRQPLRFDPGKTDVDPLIRQGQLYARHPLGLEHRCQQTAQRCDQREQFGSEDMTFAQVDDPLRLAFVKPDRHPAARAERMERGAAA